MVRRLSAGRPLALAASVCALLVVALPGAAARAAAPAPLTASVVGETPSGGGVMRFPQAVAVDPRTGDVFVGDQYGGAVQVYSSTGTFRFTIGARAMRREPGRMGVIGGVAVDRSGHLYVVDAESDRIQIFSTTDGSHLGEFGDRTVFDFMGGVRADRGITAGGVAVWQASPTSPPQVYVADGQHNRVVRFALDPTTLAVTGTPRVAQPDEPLRYPQGLAVHPDGTRLYVADNQHHKIVEFSTATMRQIGQVGTQGYGPGQFQAPYDVAVDSIGQLYVADNLNGQVDVFDADTFAYVGTFGRNGHVVGAFSIVRSVAAAAADKSGGVIVADTANNRIQVLDASGRILTAWGIPGRGAGYVTRARGAVFRPGGGIAIADTFDNRIALIDPDGTFAGEYGRFNRSVGFVTGGSATGQFLLPQALAFTTAGHLWVADTNNSRMVQLDEQGQVLYMTPQGEVAKPRSVAAAPDGSVYVADTGHGRLLRYGIDGQMTVVRTGLNNPVGVAVAPDGTPYVSAGRRVLNAADGSAVAPPPDEGTYWDGPGGLAFGPDGTVYVGEARLATPDGARVVRGTPAAGGGYAWDTIATEGAGPGQVIDPANLAVSPDGATLLVADAGNNRILRFDRPGVALPAMARLDVQLTGMTLGTVRSDPDGIRCATDCTQHFGAGRSVTLTATARTGALFSEWTGACASAGSAPTCTVRMDGDQAVGAAFAAIPPPPVQITGLRLTPGRWLLSRPADRRRHRRFRPATRGHLTIRLSEPATVTLAVQVPRPGVLTATGCGPFAAGVRVPRALRCTRFVTRSGVRTLRLVEGRTVLTLTPRVTTRTLRPGTYRLAVTATDDLGRAVTYYSRVFRLRR